MGNSPRHRSIAPGPWIAHVSGATPLASLDPHSRRFSVHPLQTLVRGRGADQLDGAYAAVVSDRRRLYLVGYSRIFSLAPKLRG